MSLVGKKLTQFNFSRTRSPKKKQIESRVSVSDWSRPSALPIDPMDACIPR